MVLLLSKPNEVSLELAKTMAATLFLSSVCFLFNESFFSRECVICEIAERACHYFRWRVVMLGSAGLEAGDLIFERRGGPPPRLIMTIQCRFYHSPRTPISQRNVWIISYHNIGSDSNYKTTKGLLEHINTQ